MSVIKLVKVGQPPLTFQWGKRPSLRCQSHSGNSSKNSSILAKAQKKIIGSAFFIRQLNQIRLLQQMTKQKKLQTCNFLQKNASISLIHKRRSLILKILIFKIQIYFMEIRLSKIFSISSKARTRKRLLKRLEGKKRNWFFGYTH